MQQLRSVVDLRAALRCLLVLLPVFAWSLLSGDVRWLQAAVMAVSTLIGVERVGLAPLGVLLQGCAAIAGFFLLYFSLCFPLLFVLACALMAAAAIGLAAFGRKLRSLGNFIFIPALYLACEAFDGPAAAPSVVVALAWMPYLLLCLLPVLLLSLLEYAIRVHRSGQSGWSQILHQGLDLGERIPVHESMLAAALAVALAASMVEYGQIGHGQWVVWSAASVVTGDVVSSRLKLLDRARGALCGVPLGVFSGSLLPHSPFCYALIVLGSVLSLVSFRRYVVGFGVRCACAAAALVVAGHALAQAADRISNVLLGGVTGCLVVFLLHVIWLRKNKQPA
jgi:hypothetical protein